MLIGYKCTVSCFFIKFSAIFIIQFDLCSMIKLKLNGLLYDQLLRP